MKGEVLHLQNFAFHLCGISKNKETIAAKKRKKHKIDFFFLFYFANFVPFCGYYSPPRTQIIEFQTERTA
jgi:hypothetical protein